MGTKLYLKFLDQTQRQQIVLVNTAQFTIGRTPDNDLQFSDSNLSRQHARIERFGDVFVLSDLNSSNGTIVNNQNLDEPVALKNNDQILLGQTVLLTIESISDEATEFATNQFQEQTEFSANNFLYPSIDNRAPKSTWQNVFLLAPLLGIVVVTLTIVLFFILGDANRRSKTQIAQANEDVLETDDENRSVRSKIDKSETADENDSKIIINAQRNVNPANNATSINLENNNATNSANAENAKTEKLAGQFLRAVSRDSNPVLTGKQIAAINAKLKTYQNLSTVRENLRAAEHNAANFERLAQTHNLNSKFLTAATLAKLNQTQGDLLATGTAIAPDLRKYGNVLGFELANDCLLVIAAYAEGNSPLAMRDKIANLAKQTPNASVATIRTIWFLRDNQKISEPAYDFALRFIVFGTMLEESGKWRMESGKLKTLN